MRLHKLLVPNARSLRQYLGYFIRRRLRKIVQQLKHLMQIWPCSAKLGQTQKSYQTHPLQTIITPRQKVLKDLNERKQSMLMAFFFFFNITITMEM